MDLISLEQYDFQNGINNGDGNSNWRHIENAIINLLSGFNRRRAWWWRILVLCTSGWYCGGIGSLTVWIEKGIIMLLDLVTSLQISIQ